MEVALKETYVISPNWGLRRNGSRAILLNLDLSTLEYMILDPIDALIVSLLDGHRSVEDLVTVIAYLLETTRELSSTLVNGVIAKLSGGPNPRLIPTDGSASTHYRVYDPSLFVTRTEGLDHLRRLEVPIVLGITLTHRCHTNCVYCYAERRHVPRSAELTLEQWRAIINQSEELGIERIDLLGGDVLARAEAPDILEYLIAKNLQFFISTKCHINADLAARLAVAGMGDRVIQISMDAPNAHLADWLSGSRGFFDRAIDSLRNLLAFGLKARAKATLTPYNIRQAPELVRLWYEIGVRDIMLVDYSRSHYHHRDDLFCDPTDSAWVASEIEGLKQQFFDAKIVYGAQAENEAKSNRVQRSVEERWETWNSRARCSAGSSTMLICPDGLVTLCEQIPQNGEYVVGDIRKQGILEIWNSPRLLSCIYPERNRFRGTACYDCAEFDKCHRASGHCFRDALFAYGTRYAPPPLCPLAPEAPRRS